MSPRTPPESPVVSDARTVAVTGRGRSGVGVVIGSRAGGALSDPYRTLDDRGQPGSASPSALIDPDSLYRRYGPMVLRRCRRLLGDEERALDAMHDTFVQVLQHRDQLHAKAPSSLLYRVATRVALNALRSQRRSRLVPPGEAREAALLDAIADLPDESEATGARALLSKLFAREPESSRVMAVLHYVDGLTLEETAAEVGLSVSGVRKRLRGLREKLVLLAPEAVRGLDGTAPRAPQEAE